MRVCGRAGRPSRRKRGRGVGGLAAVTASVLLPIAASQGVGPLTKAFHFFVDKSFLQQDLTTNAHSKPVDLVCGSDN